MILYVILFLIVLGVGAVAFSYTFDWVKVDEPNIGVIRVFGGISEEEGRIFPGELRHIWQFKRLLKRWVRLIEIPPFFDIDIEIDNATTHGVNVEVDLKYRIHLLTPRRIDPHDPEADDYPAFGAAVNLIKFAQPGPNESLVTRVTRDGQVIPGKIDEIFTGLSQNIVTGVITQYRPSQVDRTPAVRTRIVKQIATRVNRIIPMWGVLDREWLQVQDIRVPDHMDRAKLVYDAAAERRAQKLLTTGHIEQVKQYKDELGEEFAKLHMITLMFEKTKPVFNWFGAGGSIVKSLFKMLDEDEK